METILLTGGTGLVGSALSTMLIERGYEVIILTRKMPRQHKTNNIKYALWNVENKTIDKEAIQQADHIIHLAGAGVVDKRWTAVYKKEIVDSRINSSNLIIEALKNVPNHVKTIVSASAIGWYGADKNPIIPFVENDPADTGFLGETCRLWEDAVNKAADIGIRVVKYRLGIVLSNKGGALQEFKKPLRFGLAAILGNGKQIISWIHIEDLCRLFIYAIENNNIEGSYNAVAPNPISNKQLTITLAKVIKGSFYIPIYVPSFLLKLLLGEKSIEVLKSTTVSCEKIINAGFNFNFTNIEEAIKNITNQR